MTRHSRNSTANAVYTFHERQNDAKSGKYGTQKSRLGKDSLQKFGYCSLSLQPCKNPVVSLDGYIFDKEVIFNYILQKKNEYKAEMKKYCSEIRKRKAKDDILKEKKMVVACKEKAEKKARIDDRDAVGRRVINSSISNMNEREAGKLVNFWLPELTPTSEALLKNRAKKEILCPVSGLPLKYKHLTPVHFTRAACNSDDEEGYVCAVLGDTLTSSTPCAVLRPSGLVICLKAVELVKKDMICPVSGKKLVPSDIIPLAKVGTGYCAGGGKIFAKKYTPAMD